MNDRELQAWVDRWAKEYRISYDKCLEPLAGMEAFSHKELTIVYKWKFHGLWPQRKIGLMRAFPEATSLSRRAFTCPDELGALRILTLIPGVGTAGASAILMAHDPERYTVTDIRALKSLIWPLKLWSAADQGAKPSSLTWPDYLNTCRSIARRTDRPLRTVDHALWKANGRN